MEESSAAQREIAGYERELTSSIFCVFWCQSSSPLAERAARGLGAGEAACPHLVHELDVVLDYRHEQLLRLLRRRWSGGWVLMSGAAGGREGAPGWPSRRPRLLARARACLLVSPPKFRCSTRGCLCEVALPFASGSKSGWCEPFPLSHIASYFEARKKVSTPLLPARRPHVLTFSSSSRWRFCITSSTDIVLQGVAPGPPGSASASRPLPPSLLPALEACPPGSGGAAGERRAGARGGEAAGRGGDAAGTIEPRETPPGGPARAGARGYALARSGALGEGAQALQAAG